MKKRKTVNIPNSILNDERISDSEFRLFVKLGLNFGTDKVKIDDSVLHTLGIKKSTFYRLVKNLLECEYLQRNQADSTYEIAVSNMGLLSLNIGTEQSQKWDLEREKERSKEKDKDRLYIESIYNNNLILNRDTEKRDIESETILTDSKENDKEKTKHSEDACAREEPEAPLEPEKPTEAVKPERFTEEYREIIAYLNEKTGKRYSATSRVNQGHMSARLKEGFTVDDFKRVIDVKCFQWKDDPKMAKFLRPETLFGTKFDRYLNEEKVQTKVGVYGDVYTVTEEQLNSDVPF